MSFHRKFFWAAVFFLAGIFIASAFVGWDSGLLFSICIVFLASLLCLVLGYRLIAVLVLFAVIGSSYFYFDDYLYRSKNQFGANFVGEAKVIGIKQRDSYLQADFKTLDGVIRAYLDSVKSIGLGDVVFLDAKLRAFSAESARYFEKEGTHALSSYPKVVIVKEGKGIRRVLYSLRDGVANVFSKYLVGEKAALMTGITLGRNSGFSDELSGKLSATGTTHLVALSGFNVAVVASGIAYLLSFLLSRRISFYGSVAAIFLFVVMTGAEASVVRAGIMASLILWADYLEEIFSVRNALVFTALAMVLFNPKILAFDLGFQLSFVALIGIVYLRPMLDKWLSLQGNSFLSWKENLSMTLSAQIAVLPLILFSFSFMPAFSLITNVLILTFIPVTMFLGLMIVLASPISSLLSSFFAFLSNIFLGYELGVIDFFSKFSFGIRVESFSVWILLLLYGVFFFVIYTKRNEAA